ncbi:MAG: DUF4412 domain-containing protein [Prevotella sp.]|nr:DUF4412 domain-containing protein [Prevotella sp.]
MKRTKQVIMTLILLIAGFTTGVMAQVSGSLEDAGRKLTYTVSGGRLVSLGEAHHGGRQRGATFEVKAGEAISFNCKGTKDGKAAACSFNAWASTHPTSTIDGEQFDKKKISEPSVSYTYTVPRKAKQVKLEATLYITGEKVPLVFSVRFKVVDNYTVQPSTTPPTRWEPPSYSNCDHPDSHCRFEELWGEVSFRCNDEHDNSYETAEYQTVIKQEDRIQTKEESGAKLWVPDWDTYVNLKEETTVVIRVEKTRIPTTIEMIAGGIWCNFKKMAEGKTMEVEMSHCIAGGGEFELTEEQWRLAKKYRIHPSQFGSIDHQLMDEPLAIPASYVLDPDNNPTFNNIGYTVDDDDVVFACEIKNGAGTAYVFRGTMTLRNKDDKTYKLKAGLAGTLARDGKITVKQFDIKKAAKKFGITDAQLQGQVTTATATARRYEMERAIVKYKVTTGNQQGILAKVFDNYGTLERRELKKGNSVTIALTQGNVSYALDKKTKIAKRTQDADLNFLDLNAPIMKKLNLTKKGSATVIGKKSTLYTGQNVEYYVWKGLVLKKVQHNSNGTTTISEVISIEEPTSMDPKLFKLPDGYTVK